jgi:DNA-binding FrmR family transcriptional regulator
MQADAKKSVAARLGRIEGQVRGIARMVDDDRYCIDVLTQLSAVRAALARVEEEVLRDHVQHCVSHAMASGNPADKQQKVEELVAVIGKLTR